MATVRQLSTAFLLTFFSIPVLFALNHLIFPAPPSGASGLRVFPGLDALPQGPVRDQALQIYGEDYWPGGGWYSGPYGRVRYWLIGPENGKKVVLIHGLSIPAIIWKDVIPFLSNDTVCWYTISTAAATPPHPTRPKRRWQKAHIAGVSMGGGIATAFAASFPALVEDKVALVCPVGLLTADDLSRTMKFMSAPLLQTIMSSHIIRYYLHRLASVEAPVDAERDTIVELVRIQSAHLPGYNAAIASSLRDGPVRGQQEAYTALNRSGKNVLLLWGTADTTVPYRYSDAARALIPQAQLVTIDGGGHDITLSHPETVGNALVEFFGK